MTKLVPKMELEENEGIPPVPAMAPGHEGDRFLDETEVLKMTIHFRSADLVKEAIAKNKIMDENLKIKQQMCDLNKLQFQNQQRANSQELLELEKRLTGIVEGYEQGLKADIRKRLNIPADKTFSYDPVSFRVVVAD